MLGLRIQDAGRKARSSRAGEDQGGSQGRKEMSWAPAVHQSAQWGGGGGWGGKNKGEEAELPEWCRAQVDACFLRHVLG